ncbi:protein disulfide-isomerase A6 [Babesia microti strain RI]|uniref:Protein disulfide-isomerase A6 n=1 Tax=Babesia microti (strain RI) TaxID=1133968 RepID=A0A1R4ACL8_BABMR|nr:protein disulfide-isomerase A6 [Babesia microti strain RI]SJK86644.1 protein disulfide-isomerase A6 [Babesia microti strain RI]|eukprot:XP_021338776.1 protein disulfide-isomerase A6 [Babesia microti strain RI]
MAVLSIIYIFFIKLAVCNVYNQYSNVSVLDSEGFDALLQSEGTFLCQFYSENNKKANDFASDFSKLSDIFYGIIKVVATSDNFLVNKHGGNTLPSLKLFIKVKNSPHKVVPYMGKKDVDSVAAFLRKQLGTLISSRLGTQKTVKNEVITLTDVTFNQRLLKDIDSVWFVMFYAPWCGHCKALKPTWDSLASKLGNKVKVAKVDCTTETNIAQQLKIQGYPTLILFESGTKNITSGKHYQGQRTLAELESFALSFKRMIPVVQLLNNDMFMDSCNSTLCIISFLPHILDSSIAERKKQIEVIKKASMIGTDAPISLLWSQGGDQYDLEMSLNLSFGYPAIVALRMDKELYVIYKGPYTEDSVRKFISGLTVKISGAQAIPNLKPLITVDPWDESDNIGTRTEL